MASRALNRCVCWFFESFLEENWAWIRHCAWCWSCSFLAVLVRICWNNKKVFITFEQSKVLYGDWGQNQPGAFLETRLPWLRRFAFLSRLKGCVVHNGVATEAGVAWGRGRKQHGRLRRRARRGGMERFLEVNKGVEERLL